LFNPAVDITSYRQNSFIYDESTPTMAQATIYIDTNRVISTISPLLFSGFAEHMGRCIYEGIYDPDSPNADEHGLRKDVLAALRDLNLRSIRYPGGNFLSGYYWEDGIGPKYQRPRRRDLAWKTIETNQFGTDEFLHFCRELNTEPMLGVNMGTGTIQDAANLVEYCNAPVGTLYGDLRAKNGHNAPYGVKYWCIGNEMDGPWQIGHLEADEYGKKALEAAKMMRWHDSSIETVLCGSSYSQMPTYPDWDRLTLEIAWEHVNYHSMHYYARNHNNDTASYLALSVDFENFVDTLTGVLRYVKAKKRSKHDVYLSWDEWNVWYKDRSGDGNWTEAPHLSEEIYNLEDALVVAQWMNVFLRKADVLKIACLAQIVNTISPITTTKDGLLKHTTYYPIMLFSRMASGNALDVAISAPLIETNEFGDVPVLDVASSHNVETGTNAIFIVNRSQTDTVAVNVCWQALKPTRVTSAYQISGKDPKAINSFDDPEHIVPYAINVQAFDDGTTILQLPPLSFTTVEVSI
jgi:alpha-N-arabinofuranosidase